MENWDNDDIVRKTRVRYTVRAPRFLDFTNFTDDRDRDSCGICIQPSLKIKVQEYGICTKDN